MAYIDTENIPLHMPVPGTREPAQIALLNENCVTLSLHDHTDGKALAIGRMRSGLEANRPAAGSAGNVYFATDTGRFYADTGTAWVGFLTEGGQGTVTGWTLIDPVIRDTLQFGPEGSATIDNSITRTGANALRTDSNLGVGVAPAAWAANQPALQVGPTGGLMSAVIPGTTEVQLTANTYGSASGQQALIAAAASRVRQSQGSLIFDTAPSVAAGAAQTFTTRLTVDQSGDTTVTGGFASEGATGQLRFGNREGGAGYLWYASNGIAHLYDATQSKMRATVAQTGTLTLNPDAGQNALTSPADLRIGAGASVILAPASGHIWPVADSAYYLGYDAHRFFQVWATSGVVSSSSAEAKQDITPLDPAACYQAAKDVRWYDFRYRPPAFTPPEPGPDTAYDEHDSNEVKAEKRVLRDEAEAAALAAHAKMLLETAPARHQRGFVFPAGVEAKDEAGGALPPVPDLFGLEDRESTTPQADLATLGAAMQEIIRRLEALEATSGQAPAA